jgi:hypothetical protein
MLEQIYYKKHAFLDDSIGFYFKAFLCHHSYT